LLKKQALKSFRPIACTFTYMIPVSFTGLAPLMLLGMLLAGIIHHFISGARARNPQNDSYFNE